MRDGLGNKASEKSCDTIDTLIGPTTEVKGDLVYAGGLRIDGTVNGAIKAREQGNSTLIVSERAKVNGDVWVPHLILTGKIQGDVHSSECIEVHSTAEIAGDVYYKEIKMAPGATINGNLICETAQSKRKGQVANLKPVAVSGTADDRAPT